MDGTRGTQGWRHLLQRSASFKGMFYMLQSSQHTNFESALILRTPFQVECRGLCRHFLRVQSSSSWWSARSKDRPQSTVHLDSVILQPSLIKD